MTAALSRQQQSAEPGAYVALYELDTRPVGGSDILYFTQSQYETAPVVFRGKTYVPVDIEVDGFEWNGRGQLPTPRVRIANANRVLSSLVIGFDDLLGCPFTRLRTFRQFLDNEPLADPNAVFPPDVYRIERKSSHNKVFVEWELAAAMDQQGRFLPGRQILRDSCTHRYRTWNGTGYDYSKATCPYAGTGAWNEFGVATIPSADQCGKRVTDCKLRFGTAPLPTRAFPGVNRNRV